MRRQEGDRIPEEDRVPEDDAVIGRAFRRSALAIAAALAAGLGAWWISRSEAPLLPVDEARVSGPESVRALPTPDPPVIPFTDATRESGIDFVHTSGAKGERLLPETMGSGVAVFDADDDGDLDLYFVNSAPWEAGRDAPTGALYSNRGDGVFDDVTAGSGLDLSFFGMGVAVADVDADGRRDLFVTALGANRLFRNLGGGKFEDATEAAGVAGDADVWSTSAAFFDADGDGDLDLFVANYVTWSRELDFEVDYRLTGVGRAYGPPTNFAGTQPYLYLNDGAGRFRDVSENVAVENPATGAAAGKGLAVVTVDVDDDGRTDIVVANDTVRNFLYRNLGGGAFEEIGTRAGISYDNEGKATGAMGIDAAHPRNDSDLAIAIGNFANEMSSFYVAPAATGLFSDDAILSGVGPPSRRALSFGLFFFDADLDGRLDLFQANGHIENEINVVQPSQHYAQPAQLFWNCGTGCGREFVPLDDAGALTEPRVGRGAAYGDLDGDGDLDIVVTQTGRSAVLLRNDQQLGRHWLRVRLVGRGANRDAIGARVLLRAGDLVQRREVRTARSYLSQVEPALTFGLGARERVDVVELIWPDGSRQAIHDPPVDRELVVLQSDPAAGASAREFAEICRVLRDGGEPYYGQRRLRRLSEWFAAAQAGAPQPDPIQNRERQLKLAAEMIEHGHDEEALAVLAAELTGDLPTTPVGEPIEANALSTDAMAPGAPGQGDSLDGSPEVRRMALARNAHLQAGEDRNCVLRHNAASCIVPFRAGAVHAEPEHARRAAELSLAILERRPDSVSARWLLNLAHMVSGEPRELLPEALRLPDDAFAPEQDFPGWTDRAPELGVAVQDLAGGAVLDDFDGDGFLDLVTSTSDHCDGLKAFRNDGLGGFEDVTESWGLGEQLGGLNLVHADYDGDGRLDLLVLRGAWLHEYGGIRNSLLRNALDSEGRFVDVTRAAGVAEPAAPTQTAAFADYDGDGDLDLYVGNEAVPDRPTASQLFRNEGDGTFSDVTAESGVENRRYAKAVAWGDFDDDGDPDLYVSNIGPNRLYRNEGDGSFRDVAPLFDVARPEGRSFATWFFDFDNDGRLDLFVADYGAFGDTVMASYFGVPPTGGGHPLLYHNRGDRFEESSESLGLVRPTLPMGANYADFDNDGWLDVYLGTGNPRFEMLLPNVAYRNAKGERFSEVGFAGGFAHLQKGHGVAFGDVDNDGDQDLLHQLGGFYPGDAYANALFENPLLGKPRTGAVEGASWVTLRLEGVRANRFGIGARVALRAKGPSGTRTIHRLVGGGGSFGGSSLQQEIGLGDAREIEEIRIRWPGSGSDQRLRDLAPNRIYRVVEGEDEARPVALPSFALGGSDAAMRRLAPSPPSHGSRHGRPAS